MYTFKADSRERRSGQTAMHELLTGLLKVMAPILAMTADEAWFYIDHKEKKSSIHTEPWPQGSQESLSDKDLNEKWARLIALREAVLKRLEEKRQKNEIGSSLEASVTLITEDRDYKKLFKDNTGILRYLFITSGVEVKGGPVVKGDLDVSIPVAIYIEKAKGAKCQRCWNYSQQVGSFKDHPTLCERCVKTVEHKVNTDFDKTGSKKE
jgi:isoleucyl-tRNA synthetase